jgi:MarR family transcriptional regulator, transcriptional regulator for hemolysin
VPQPDLVPPIGIRLARAARTATQAFEHAMAEAGGSISTWQVLLLVRSKQWSTQSELAAAMGITGATLTHHLNALERSGLVRRWRETDNRRVQHVELTSSGETLFERLRHVAERHDARLRSYLGANRVKQLAELLEQLEAGLASAAPAGAQAAAPAVAPARKPA